jgi:hypothetical protein
MKIIKRSPHIGETEYVTMRQRYHRMGGVEFRSGFTSQQRRHELTLPGLRPFLMLGQYVMPSGGLVEFAEGRERHNAPVLDA